MKPLARELVSKAHSGAVSAFPKFSVMNFNVLAHGWNGDESLPQFESRRELNCKHISSLNPTIVVLEEVDRPEVYQPHMESLGYDQLHCDQKNYGAFDYTCIFTKSKSIQILGDKIETLRFQYPTPGQCQFALLCRMELVETGHQWLLVAQHAKAGRTERDETTRLKQSMELFAHIEEMQKELPAPLPILWVGDMNASDSAHEGKYPNRWYPAAVGGIETAVDSEVSWKNPVSFTSAMVDARGCEPNFTTCKMRGGKLLCHTIDYILLERGKFKCVGYLEDVSSADVLAPTYLPHPQWGSDHLTVYVELEPTWAASKPNAAKSSQL